MRIVLKIIGYFIAANLVLIGALILLDTTASPPRLVMTVQRQPSYGGWILIGAAIGLFLLFRHLLRPRNDAPRAGPPTARRIVGTLCGIVLGLIAAVAATAFFETRPNQDRTVDTVMFLLFAGGAVGSLYWAWRPAPRLRQPEPFPPRSDFDPLAVRRTLPAVPPIARQSESPLANPRAAQVTPPSDPKAERLKAELDRIISNNGSITDDELAALIIQNMTFRVESVQDLGRVVIITGLNHPLRIRHRETRGVITTRNVVVHQLLGTDAYTPSAIYGTCDVYKGKRRFGLAFIEEAIDGVTGRKVTDIPARLREVAASRGKGES